MQKDVSIRDWEDLAVGIRNTYKACPRPIFRTLRGVLQVPGYMYHYAFRRQDFVGRFWTLVWRLRGLVQGL